jgi:hypothetical protein
VQSGKNRQHLKRRALVVIGVKRSLQMQRERASGESQDMRCALNELLRHLPCAIQDVIFRQDFGYEAESQRFFGIDLLAGQEEDAPSIRAEEHRPEHVYSVGRRDVPEFEVHAVLEDGRVGRQHDITQQQDVRVDRAGPLTTLMTGTSMSSARRASWEMSRRFCMTSATLTALGEVRWVERLAKSVAGSRENHDEIVGICADVVECVSEFVVQLRTPDEMVAI